MPKTSRQTILDTPVPHLPRVLSEAGYVWFGFLLASFFFELPELAISSSVIALGIAIWTHFYRTPWRAHGHSAFLPALLASGVAFVLNDAPVLMRFSYSFLPLIVVYNTVNLLRSRQVIFRSAWTFLAFLTLIHVVSPELAPSGSVIAVLVAALVLWLGRQKIGRWLGLGLAAIIITAKHEALSTAKFSFFVSEANALMVVLFVVVLAILLRQFVKDRRRFRGDDPTVHGLMVGGILVVLFMLALVFQASFGSNSSMIWLSTGLGLSLAARELLIYGDKTRHPRERGIPFKSYLEEFGILNRTWVFQPFVQFFGAPEVEKETPKPTLAPKGETIFSPYEAGQPRWVPLVMHLHSNRWEGAFTPQEMVEHYAGLGAGAVILTDHNRITCHPANHSSIRAYEHGWGPHHHHVLALEPEKTVPEYYPFGSSHKQKIRTLRRLRAISRFLILAHPQSGKAWTKEDVLGLDYDALEVFNKSAVSLERWDEALSGGQLVWGTAGDDCHDLRSRHQTGKRFMLLDIRDAESLREDGSVGIEAVFSALDNGQFVAVEERSRELTRTLSPEELPQVLEFERKGDSLVVRFDRNVERIACVTDHGETSHIVENKDQIMCSVPAQHSYCRIELHHGPFAVAFNPLARIEKQQ